MLKIWRSKVLVMFWSNIKTTKPSFSSLSNFLFTWTIRSQQLACETCRCLPADQIIINESTSCYRFFSPNMVGITGFQSHIWTIIQENIEGLLGILICQSNRWRRQLLIEENIFNTLKAKPILNNRMSGGYPADGKLVLPPAYEANLRWSWSPYRGRAGPRFDRQNQPRSSYR